MYACADGCGSFFWGSPDFFTPPQSRLLPLFSQSIQVCSPLFLVSILAAAGSMFHICLCSCMCLFFSGLTRFLRRYWLCYCWRRPSDSPETSLCSSCTIRRCLLSLFLLNLLLIVSGPFMLWLQMLRFYLYVIVFFSWPSLCAVSILTLSYSCCFYFFVTKKTGVGGGSQRLYSSRCVSAQT
jgi:hypothetical protein